MYHCPFCGNELMATRGFPYHWQYNCPENDHMVPSEA